jgi:hypothetical protein
MIRNEHKPEPCLRINCGWLRRCMRGAFMSLAAREQLTPASRWSRWTCSAAVASGAPKPRSRTRGGRCVLLRRRARHWPATGSSAGVHGASIRNLAVAVVGGGAGRRRPNLCGRRQLQRRGARHRGVSGRGRGVTDGTCTHWSV